MTIRLSAMFEEHMRRIIYNWKSARRRENVRELIRDRKTRKIRTVRKNGLRQSTRYHSSDDESEEEISPVSSPVRKSVTPRKLIAIPNGHASTSRSNGSVPRSATKIQRVKNTAVTSDESDLEKNIDSEDRYVIIIKPLLL